MLDTEVPDKFSIITYVSQFYHLLKDEDNSRSPSLPVREVKEVMEGENSGEASSPQGTPKSVPRSVFLSSNPILRNNKFCPSIKLTGGATVSPAQRVPLLQPDTEEQQVLPQHQADRGRHS